MKRILLLACAASGVFFVTAGTAHVWAASRTDAEDSPIAVEACNAYTMNAGKAAPKTSTIEIRFRDTGDVAAKAVDFDVDWGHGNVQAIRDVGTFSPGITIAHKFQHPDPEASSPLFPHPPVICRVESVQLANGSAWTGGSGGKS